MESCPLCKGAGYLARPRTDGRLGSEAVPCACKRGELESEIWRRARAASNLPEALAECAFDTYRAEHQPAAFAAATEFAAWPERQWLVLRGGCGTGKTHLLIAAANALLSTRRPLYFVVPDLLDYLRAGIREGDGDADDTLARTRHVRDCDVLFLDDYGTENPTPFANERLFEILDHRYRHALPTAITTNLADAQMDRRIASRLGDIARARTIHMRPGDYRQSDARADELAALLGDLDALPRIAAAAD